MSRGGNITLTIVMWCAIAAYVVAAGRHAKERRGEVVVGELVVSVADTAEVRVVTERKVAAWLAADGIEPVGKRAEEVDTHRIAALVRSHPEVREASAWCDMEGRLTVRVAPRTPVLRVRTEGGYRFWLTDDGYILPDRGDFAALTPVVTGRVAFPFSPSATGSYERLRLDNYRDFLERFTALAAERGELASRLGATEAEIRARRASSPKRWWSAEKKKMFAEERQTKLAELERQRAETARAIASIEGQEGILRKKERKSYQSFLFLSKLAKFVEFIGHDRFWRAQIVQINAIGGAVGGGAEWSEPQLELVPRVGDHTILLGGLDGGEKRRLGNLRLFYESAIWYEGWDTYDYIDIKYANQIVCTK